MKVLLTGTPCSGKSTAIRLLEDLGYSVIHESAAELIRDSEYHPAKDYDMFNYVLHWKIEKAQRAIKPGELTFLDRSYLDAVAFFKVLGKPIPEYLQKHSHLDYYKIFLFEPLPWIDDGIRHEGTEFQLKIHEALKEVYPTYIPVPDFGKPEIRVEFILKEISKW